MGNNHVTWGLSSVGISQFFGFGAFFSANNFFPPASLPRAEGGSMFNRSLVTLSQ